MSGITQLLVLAAVAAVSAIAGAWWVHVAERAHFERLADTIYNTGYDEGWRRRSAYIGTMVPDEYLTTQASWPAIEPPTVVADPPAAGNDAAMVSVAAMFDGIRLNLGLL